MLKIKATASCQKSTLVYHLKEKRILSVGSPCTGECLSTNIATLKIAGRDPYRLFSISFFTM